MSEEHGPDQSIPNAGESNAASQAGSSPHGGAAGGASGAGGGSGGGGGFGQSSLGMDANIAALLACSLGLITGVLFIILEKESRLVRFWAWQITAVSGIWIVVNILLNFLPCFGQVLTALIMLPLGIILWIVCMVKAYQGQAWKLPVVGDFAEQQAG